MNTSRRFPHIAILALAAIAFAAVRHAPAAEYRVGYLAAATPAHELGAEAGAGSALAAKLRNAELIFVPTDGQFVNGRHQAVALADFRVLWYHEGDTDQPTAVSGARSFPMLRKYVADGGGLLLSGAALSVVHTMGVEPARPRVLRGGRDSYTASLITQQPKHPIFAGLKGSGPFDDGPIPITSAGYPAFSDFHGSGGPTTGMLLARAGSAEENPLVEYQLGRGRIIVMGWRLPHYADGANTHRANLERLAANILDYLGDPEQWQKISIAQQATQATGPGIPAEQWASLTLAIHDLGRTFGAAYPRAAQYIEALNSLRQSHDRLAADPAKRDELAQVTDAFRKLRNAALLDNPLMKFDRLLLVQRSAANLGLPANWESNSSLSTSGFDNRLCILSPVHPEGRLSTFYVPPVGRFVGDVDLHFDGDRILFSMPGDNGRWQVHELMLNPGAKPRELPLIHEPDIDNYDACYLPDGRIIFTSTAPYIGVPCVYGGSHITNTYLLERDGSIRQLTVDQEHNWCPTVLNDGRVMYLRWEYTDLPHAHSRRLFSMNPDGTTQMALLSTNSYFPNSFFYARPIPGHPTQIVGIATGHHGNARSGRLLIVDPARARKEAEPVVHEIPGRSAPVRAIIRDQLTDGVWPQFLHPYPLSDKYFLVSAKPSANAPWGIYLVDVFNNMVLLKEMPGHALFEPISVRKTAPPPSIPDRVDLKRKDALVYLTDVYMGDGLKGIPRGTVKKLRVFTYHFSYRGMGGLLGSIGMDGPWDIKRVLGTVPVETDGSAVFRIPANTPIAVQPLDGEGKALQLMRSWFTAMPGETLSCIGCHESQNGAPPSVHTMAARKAPAEIHPWRGPVRGFAFQREVQPVLDAHCIRCHDGTPTADGKPLASLRGDQMITDWSTGIAGHVDPSIGGKFSVAYAELHRFVRRPGIESNIHLLSPMDFHADSTELVQILRRGHYGVRLNEEAWDRLITWIDLNAPYHGTWTEMVGEKAVRPIAARKRELLKRYTGVDDDPEQIPARATYVSPSPAGQTDAARAIHPALSVPGWPFDAIEARRRQAADGDFRKTLQVTNKLRLELVRIPAGEFVMGDSAGREWEVPPHPARIEKAFWIGRYEITNEQYEAFDPHHGSGVETMHGYQFGMHGYPLNRAKQPVVRVSWNQAMRFCRWLSERTGQRFTLPTEAQWEYACRAGSAEEFSFGSLDADYSKHANVGDIRLREFAFETYIQPRLISSPNRYDDWIPRDDRFNDGGFVSMDIGQYVPNAWGLHDMHGNVWEWTLSADRPYLRMEGGRDDPEASGRLIVRGGSWYDRPKRCTSTFRLSYWRYQRAYNVGFRVMMTD